MNDGVLAYLCLGLHGRVEDQAATSGAGAAAASTAPDGPRSGRAADEANIGAEGSCSPGASGGVFPRSRGAHGAEAHQAAAGPDFRLVLAVDNSVQVAHAAALALPASGPSVLAVGSGTGDVLMLDFSQGGRLHAECDSQLDVV